MNTEGPEIGRCLTKGLGYSPWFWKWRPSRKEKENNNKKQKQTKKHKRATEAGVWTPGTYRCNTTVSRSANQSATLRGALVLTSFYCGIYSSDSEFFISARSECKGSRRIRFIAMHKNVRKKEVREEKRRTWHRKKKEKRKIQARHGGGCSNPGHLSVQYHSKQIG